MLAVMEAAIADRVDLLSISIASRAIVPYYDDMTVIGALGAIQKGVFVSYSAGNEGPIYSVIFNTVP